MAEQKKVIDASVLVKAFTKEEGSEKAVLILQDFVSGGVQIVVPEMIFLETLNALRYNKFHRERLQEINSALWGFNFPVERLTQFLIEKAVGIAVEHNFTLYDSIYAAIASMHGCPLITADKELQKYPNAIPL